MEWNNVDKKPCLNQQPLGYWFNTIDNWTMCSTDVTTVPLKKAILLKYMTVWKLFNLIFLDTMVLWFLSSLLRSYIHWNSSVIQSLSSNTWCLLLWRPGVGGACSYCWACWRPTACPDLVWPHRNDRSPPLGANRCSDHSPCQWPSVVNQKTEHQ